MAAASVHKDSIQGYQPPEEAASARTATVALMGPLGRVFR